MIGIVLALEVISGVAIALQAIARVNRMTPGSAVLFAVAWVALGSAAVAVVLRVVSGHAQADWQGAAFMAAVAVLVWIDRRRSR